jgi:bacterioferritin-associated ferredoxin
VYLCHCLAVTDDTIRTAMEDGARTIAEVGERCGAGTGCGGCHLVLRQMLAEYGRSGPDGRRRRRRAA